MAKNEPLLLSEKSKKFYLISTGPNAKAFLFDDPAKSSLNLTRDWETAYRYKTLADAKRVAESLDGRVIEVSVDATVSLCP